MFLFVHFRTSVRLLGWSYLSVIVFVTSIHQVHTVGLQNAIEKNKKKHLLEWKQRKNSVCVWISVSTGIRMKEWNAFSKYNML